MNAQNEPVAPTDAVRAALLKLMEQRAIPAMQFAIVRDGRIAMQGALGCANIEHQVQATDRSIFSVISMAKAFTGVAVMQLVERGKLDFGAPVSEYLTDLPSAWQAITILELVTFTSGLPEIMTMSADFSTGLIGDGDEEAAWQAAYALPIQFKPGDGYRYVQTNFALLGRVIHQVTGKPFVQFVTEHQLAPAQMADTLYAGDSDIIPGRANSYTNVSSDGSRTGKISNCYINCPPVLRTAAGLHTTARDLAQWVIALQGGQLLKQPQSLDMLLSPMPSSDDRPGVWALGWVTAQSPLKPISAAVGGAKAQVVLYPDGLALILLTNLIGAFPEHFAPISAEPVDLHFLDAIVSSYVS